MSANTLRSLEICAGAGGQALGLEMAGFDPVMLVDNDKNACDTLRKNRPQWRVVETDLREFVADEHEGVLDVDLLSCGVPSAPFSVAGSQDGTEDGRDLLKPAIYLARGVRPRAIMIESTPTLLTAPKFSAAREFVLGKLRKLGYEVDWQVLNAEDFGVPQTRKSAILIAMKSADFDRFVWPTGQEMAPTVGQALRRSMASRGWRQADEWAKMANRPAPTIVGGSKKHGGADLGPTRTKRAWLELGVDGHGVGNDVPERDYEIHPELGRKGFPQLTTAQVALLQGIPDSWTITGRKTASYRQIAQCFPPPLAAAIGHRIAYALGG